MQKFTTVSGSAAPLMAANVNTDVIIRIERLSDFERDELEPYAFEAWRYREDGSEDPDFVLNQGPWRGAPILLAGPNFGCGSSREGAVYTLEESGVRVVIAPSFGDIFAANCMKNGLLTIRLPAETVAELRSELEKANDPSLTVDLESETITKPSGETLSFQADSFQKHCLINGLNEIDLSLEFAEEVEAFETRHRQRLPWLAPKEA